MSKKISIAIHGGAGTIIKSDMTPELEAAYHVGLEEALEKGYRLLEGGKKCYRCSSNGYYRTGK